MLNHTVFWHKGAFELGLFFVYYVNEYVCLNADWPHGHMIRGGLIGWVTITKGTRLRCVVVPIDLVLVRDRRIKDFAVGVYIKSQQ